MDIIYNIIHIGIDKNLVLLYNDIHTVIYGEVNNMNEIISNLNEAFGSDLELSNGKILLQGKPLDQWHKGMWEWIAKSPSNTKTQFVDRNLNEFNKGLLITFCNCFGCLCAKIAARARRVWCSNDCPLCSSKRNVGCLNGLYVEWLFNQGFCSDEYEDTPLFLTHYTLSLQIASRTWDWGKLKIENENQD